MRGSGFRTLLREVAIEYFHACQQFDHFASRGLHNRADEYLDRMKQIENCVTVHENSTAWRRSRQREPV